jgi:hypothetical protein
VKIEEKPAKKAGIWVRLARRNSALCAKAITESEKFMARTANCKAV